MAITQKNYSRQPISEASMDGAIKGQTNFTDCWAITNSQVNDISDALSGLSWTEQSVVLLGGVRDFMNGVMIYPFDTSKISGADNSPVQLGRSDLTDSQGDPIKARKLTNALYTDIVYEIDTAPGSGSDFEYYGNFLDHEPYCTYSIILPYAGEVPLSSRDVINCIIKVQYAINLSTGDATVYVSSGRPVGANRIWRVIETRSCQVGIQAPFGLDLTSENHRNQNLSLFLSSMTMAANVASIGNTQLVSSSTTKKGAVDRETTNRARSKETGKYGKQLVTHSVHNAPEEVTKERYKVKGGDVAAEIGGAYSGMLNDIVGSTPRYATGTSNADLTSFSQPNYPVLRRFRPHIHDINNYGHYFGYAVAEEGVLGEHEGYCEVSRIHMDGFPDATPHEINEIEDALKSGVILPPIHTSGGDTNGND